MRKYKYIAIGIFLFFGCTLNAQENIGIAHDNYAVLNQHTLNPAAIVDPKVWLDVNLVGVAAYARNNFVYLNNSVLSKPTQLEDYGFNLGPNHLKAYIDAEVMGPSVSLALGDHSFGIHTKARVSGLARKIPNVLGEIMATEDSIVDDGTYQTRNTRMKTMGWAEFGVSYGKILKKEGEHLFTGAINLNRLIGVYDVDLIVRQATLTVENATGVLNNLSGKYGYAQPAWKAGKGWGVNVGAQYKKMKEDVTQYIPHTKASGCKMPEYEYKIGLSLLDFGYINFRQDAAHGEFDENTNTEDLDNIINGNISEAGIPTSGTSFTAMLPTALSAQFDYNVKPHLYASATIVQKIGFPRAYGTERANLFALSARYERKWLGFGLPLTMQDYIHPQIGATVRLGPVIIGTDHLLPFLFRSDIYAADFFAYLHIPINKSFQCMQKKEKSPEPRQGRIRNTKRPRKRHTAKCPDW